MPHRVLSVLIGAMGLLAFSSPLIAGDTKADAELKRLAVRAEAKDDADKLRRDLSAFRQSFPGSPQAMKAAELLRGLTSPFDQFDASVIPQIEKFDWHPKETVAVLGEHRGRQGGAVTAVLYSKHGKWLASASTNGLVRVWEPTSGRLLHTVGHSAGSYSLAFSKDNSLLASGGGDGNVNLWDMAAGVPKLKGSHKVASTPLFGLAIAPNNRWFTTAGSDNRLYVWDLGETPPKEASSADGHRKPVMALSVSADAKMIATASQDNTIRVWNLSPTLLLKEKASSGEQSAAMNSVAFHPTDPKLLAAGSADGTVGVWTVGAKLTLKHSAKGKNGAVQAIAFSASGKTLAAAYADGSVRTFSVATTGLQEKAVLEGHIMLASSVAFSPDGQTLATGSHDWTVRQWPAVSGPRPKDKTIARGHLSHVYTLAFSPDEKMLASGSYDNTARLWDLPGDIRERPLKADGAVYAVDFAPDSKSVAAGGNFVKFRTYDTATSKFVFAFSGHQGGISRLVWSPDGTRIATSSTDKSVRLWNPRTGKEVGSINTFETHVNQVAFSPNGKFLLAASGYYLYDKGNNIVVKDGKTFYKDSTVRLYEADGQKELLRWKDDNALAHYVQFSPDSRQFYAGISDKILWRWNVTDTKGTDAVKLSEGVNVGVSAFVCSPDGRWLACYGPDYRVVLLERDTGKKVREWALGEQFGSIAFAPDSRHLAIGVGTGVVLLLRLENARK